MEADIDEGDHSRTMAVGGSEDDVIDEVYDLDDPEFEDDTLAEQEDTFSDNLNRALALLSPKDRAAFLQKASEEWEKRREEDLCAPVAMLY